MDILAELRAGIQSSSTDETEALGRELATALPADVALALSGELGTGKTTLVRGIARGLGIKASVTSPTYNIYSIYQGSRQLLHMDAYRLGDSHDLDSLSLDEFLRSPYLVVVEWPENVPGFFHEYPTYRIRLSIDRNHRHQLRLDGPA